VLSIREEQIETMRLEYQEQFVSRLVVYLSQCYGDQLASMPRDDLRTFVEKIAITAPEWGLHNESEITEVAMVMVEMKIALGVRTMPEWFSTIVEDNTLNPPSKLYQLIHRWHQKLDNAARSTPTTVE